MQGASRESYAAARAQLERMTDGTALAAAAEQILAVAGLLAKEPRLRRALSDPARTGQQRAELLDGLVGGQISAEARQLLGILVSGRWPSAGELRDGTERLGVEALIVAADRTGDLAEVEDELFRFGQIVGGSPQLTATIGDASLAPARRTELIDQLIGAKAKPATVRLAQQAVGGFGGRAFAGALTRLVELAAAQRERSVAYVTVAEPLSDADEQRLGTALAQRYGRQVSVKVTVDPRVLGGARVLIGSDLYDGTIARRLADARTSLVS
jgi:F-type H+-transporting ATPase subunit delta